MMLRRTALRCLATAACALPFRAFRAWAQTVNFPGQHGTTLRALAGIVLPSELGREGAERTVTRFEQWVRDYRPGAEMEHGYGFTRLRNKPPSPASAYLPQLEMLRVALANPDLVIGRKAIAAALETADIKELPRMPDGKHIISDLMSFYFRGSDANDLCYRAAIQRDVCRGLDGSNNAPPPMKGTA